MRIGVRAAAAAMTITAAGLVLAGCGLRSDHLSDHTTLHQSIDRVNVDDVAGSVTVRVGDGPTTVQRNVEYRFGRPGRTMHVAGHTLNIGPCGAHCSADYVVRVPAGTAVTGSVSSGSLSLTGVGEVDVRSASGSVIVTRASGPVRASVASGSVRIDGAERDVTVTSASGSIRAADVAGNVTVRTESGDVAVSGSHGRSTAAASASGDVTVTAATVQNVTARTGNGDVTLRVPDGDYRVLTSTGSGRVTDEVGDDPAAAHSLRATSGNGDVRILAHSL